MLKNGLLTNGYGKGAGNISYKYLIGTAGLAILLYALYQEVIGDLITHWSEDENFSHGFIIPFMSLYFIWEEKDRLSELTVKPDYKGAAVVLAGILFYTLGNIGAELFTMRVSMVIVIWGLVILNLGMSHFKFLLFPLTFLLLMIPPPAIIFNLIAFPLQLLAAKSATFTLQICDIPVLREGNVIRLSTTVLEVAEACSGIRSLVSLITLGVIFAHFMHKDLWKKIFLVISTIPIAIFANAVRVSGTGILAHFWGEEAAEGFYHTFAGFFVFAVALGLLFLENYLLFVLLPKISNRKGKK